jgi:hypothetical protein
MFAARPRGRSKVDFGTQCADLEIILIKADLRDGIWWSIKPSLGLRPIPRKEELGLDIAFKVHARHLKAVNSDRYDRPAANVGAPPLHVATPEFQANIKLAVFHLDEYL